MKHKVSELEGAVLDAAVAKAQNAGPTGEADWLHHVSLDFAPSTDWQQGGPIIDRERIELSISERGEGWWANLYGAISLVGVGAWGPTPLIAAMRAYVASKFGEEVELP